MNFINLKNNQKKLSIIFIITILFSFISLQSAKIKKDFIYVVPKIKNFEVLNTNIGKYSITPFDKSISLEDVEQVNFLNGHIFYNVPNGKYQITGSYINETDEVILEKEKDWEKIYLNLEGVSFSKLEEKFLNILTLCLIGFNIYLYFNTQKRLPKKNILNILFFFLTGKIFFSLRIDPSNNILIFIDFLLTRILLFSMIFYFLKNIFPKKFINLKRIIYFILLLIYFYNIVIALILYSPQYLVYLLEEHPKFLSVVSVLRKTIDLSRTLFILFLISFIVQIKKIKRESLFSWIVIWITYFILEFFKELLPKSENLIYFIDLMEIFCVYWALVFYNFKIYSRNVMRTILYSITITLSYISLFYFKNITESAIILGSTLILDFYANIITKIMHVEDKNIQNIYNRLCLIQDIESFEKTLEEEISKYISCQKIKVKILIHKKEFYNFIKENENNDLILPKENLKISEYDYAYRIGFNKNNEIALIFIKENENPLTLGEQNFIINLSEKISNIINKLRLESLYRELK